MLKNCLKLKRFKTIEATEASENKSEVLKLKVNPKFKTKN